MEISFRTSSEITRVDRSRDNTLYKSAARCGTSVSRRRQMANDVLLKHFGLIVDGLFGILVIVWIGVAIVRDVASQSAAERTIQRARCRRIKCRKSPVCCWCLEQSCRLALRLSDWTIGRLVVILLARCCHEFAVACTAVRQDRDGRCHFL